MPSTASEIFSGRLATKLRWVKRRWKPIVTAWPMTTTNSAATPISHHPTGPPVPRKITNSSSTGGPNATIALRIRLYSGGVYGASGGATARGAGDGVRA